MLRSTLGQVLINEALPEELRDYNRVLDKRGVKQLLQEVAEKHPDQYRQVAKRLSDVGRKAAFSSGSYSFGLKNMRQSLAARKMRLETMKELRDIYTSNASDEEKQKAIIDTIGKRQAALGDDVMKEALEQQNPLAMQAVSGSRGNKFNLNSLLGADMLYTDHRGKALPIPVTRSYSMGLRPYEYFAGGFGARKGVIDLKEATQDAGFFGKQLVQAAHRLLVSKMDADGEYDETNPRGFPAETSDPDNIGALLAHPVGGYPRNTPLTPKILKELQASGTENILVRSPTVGGPDDGGIYARDAGIRERGGIAPVGDFVGTTAGQSIAEPITQGQISSKHSGGVAGAGSGAISGFKHLNSLVQVPKKMPGGAAHSQVDGRVSDIREAPQGGHYVTIGGQEHYVGQGFLPQVKPGDEIEAGDVISDGIPNPAEVVKHKGIGEGRRYFTQAFGQAIKDAGISGDRRNVELLARGLINHVRLDEELGDYVPDDVVPYQSVESKWRPRTGHVVVPAKQAKGYYLERPVLHYTIGDKIRPSMIKQLESYGVKNIAAHRDPPPFSAEMIRGMANASHDPDWMVKMLGSYQKSSILDAAHRGAVSDEAGSSYVPALARGENFGREGLTKGWQPVDLASQPSNH